MNSDERLDQLTRWVRRFDALGDASPVPVSEDASFRRYYRVQGDESLIVMDAPSELEDSRPFIDVAAFLASMELNSPRIVEFDLEKGFLLVTDLGCTQYLQQVDDEPDTADALYSDAIDALIVMQKEGKAFQGQLPAYDETLVRFETTIFRDWLCGRHLRMKFSDCEEREWQRCCDVLADCTLSQPTVFVHRDYHSRNLMVTETDNPGILDFQGAVEGPYVYDLVSLLRDCYIRWPDDFVARHMERFFVACESGKTREDFVRDFDLVGVQRHLKAAGIFARLFHRDGKSAYLKDIPRTLAYVVDASSQYDELHFIAEYVSNRVLPALEVVVE